MDIFKRTQDLFKRFPGIGERQAMRFAYFLATADEGYIAELQHAIAEIRKSVRRCPQCFAFSEKFVKSVCDVCADTMRDRTTVLVVEKDADRERFRKSHTYSGMYFVLGGLAPAIEKDTASHIRSSELVRMIERKTYPELSEIILALSATPDGERTEALLRAQLEPITSKNNIGITILGKGLSTGTEIEYSDADTLKNALKNRQ